jgi:hypothetical protein
MNFAAGDSSRVMSLNLPSHMLHIRQPAESQAHVSFGTPLGHPAKQTKSKFNIK